jgi:hypothetical protein
MLLCQWGQRTNSSPKPLGGGLPCEHGRPLLFCVPQVLSPAPVFDTCFRIAKLV